MARPKTALIDREDAVRTALEMIDEDGLSSFSLEKLSKRLGVRGPSLYHHFDDRADLLAHVARLVLTEVPARSGRQGEQLRRRGAVRGVLPGLPRGHQARGDRQVDQASLTRFVGFD